jgi:2,3-bisphosphoglycerate-independent phosphoglycerate mutase
MKYALIIPDGCADEPQESLGGKTPLEAAQIPAMDAIAAAGVVGRANHTPKSLPAGSDVANLSLFGYNPIEYYTGRAPLEAAAQGIELGQDDWAIRCNLVTIEDQVMKSFTAGQVSTAEAAELLRTVQEQLGSAADTRECGGADIPVCRERPGEPGRQECLPLSVCKRLEFRPGVSYRNLLIYRGAGEPPIFSTDTSATAPHDLTDKSVLDDYPRGPGSDLLNHLMSESVALFANHPVNVARRAAGKLPVTNIWLWGLGGTPHLTPFFQLHGKRGAMITAVDLLRGLATLIGWRRIEVPGATGYLDTDYAAKGRYAIAALGCCGAAVSAAQAAETPAPQLLGQSLSDVDLVCVHVEATDEASHEGNAAAKVEALEQIDRHIVAPLHEALKRHGDYRILVTPDHPTPLRTKTHSHGDVPFALAGSGIAPDAAATYDDPTAGRSVLAFDDGWRLMGYFLGT